MGKCVYYLPRSPKPQARVDKILLIIYVGRFIFMVNVNFLKSTNGYIFCYFIFLNLKMIICWHFSFLIVPLYFFF